MESPLTARSALNIERRFNENEPARVSQSDVAISATVVTDTIGVLATAATGENLRIEHLVARNVTGGSASLRVYLVPAGDSPVIADNALYIQTIASGDSAIINEVMGYQLTEGESLQVFTPASDAFVIAGRLTRITQGR